MFLWILIVGSIAAFLTACGIGANDVANSFATSVGAKVLTMRQALIIAAIFEFGGAVLMGSRVTDTIRKGIVDGDLFDGQPEVLMFGMLCASISTMTWLFLATYFKLPVSTTHSTVGAVVGFSLVFAVQSDTVSDSIKWNKIYLIIASWVISPFLSGIFTLIIFLSNKYYAFVSSKPIKRTLIIFPIMIGLTIVINIFFIIYKGSPQLSLDEIPLWKAMTIAFSTGLGLTAIAYAIIYSFYDRIIDFLDNRFDAKNSEHDLEWEDAMGINSGAQEETRLDDLSSHGSQNSNQNSNTIDIAGVEEGESNTDDNLYPDLPGNNSESACNTDSSEPTYRRSFEHDKFKNMQMYSPKIEFLFSYLQIVTACLDSFAHGANDVANSIGPYAAIYTIYTDGDFADKADVPIWILVGGGVGIVLGLGLWGKRIIYRVGTELAGITPTRGFATELGSSLTVVLASRLEIPVSTTHCQVGSVVFVGLADGVKNVDFKILAIILLSWVVTLPIAGLLSAALFMFGGYSPKI